MRPKIAEFVPPQIWEVYEEIRDVIEALPETIETDAYVIGVKVSRDMAVGHLKPNCHIMARALSKFFPVAVHDGYVSLIGGDGRRRDMEHSWLTMECDPKFIIDPWPLAAATGPAIFLQDIAYHFGPELSFPKNCGKGFESEVQDTANAIAQALEAMSSKRIARTA